MTIRLFAGPDMVIPLCCVRWAYSRSESDAVRMAGLGNGKDEFQGRGQALVAYKRQTISRANLGGKVLLLAG